jgi:hypothetical protein
VERVLFTDRGTFQWWSYTVSHGQLLLRSPKSADRPTQIDILFKNVSAVELRTVMEGLEVIETDARPKNAAGDDRVFLVRSRDFAGFVLAGAVTRDEGDHEYYEQSPLLPSLSSKRA